MVLVGLGEEGRIVASSVFRHPELKIVAAVDPAWEGKPLSDVIAGAGDIVIQRDVSAAFRNRKGAVAVICKGSRLPDIEADLIAALDAGLHVVSSCAELANASFVDPEFAERIDDAASGREVGVLGTGFNPGFVFDRLVSTLGSVVGEARHVEAGRRVDLLGERKGTLRMAGVGATLEEFEAGVEDGRFGQVGLSESCALVAEGLDLQVDEVEESIDPIVASAALDAGGIQVPKGRVRGMQQIARAFDEGREVIRLSLEFDLQPVEARDWIRIEADPPVEMVIPGGIPGDTAMGWAIANAIPRVVSSEPGLLSVLDLPAGR